MKNQRRMLLKIFPALLASTFVGCASRKEDYRQWKESQYPYRYYEEEISSFMRTKDGSKLVVITPNYHYIFPLPKKLANSLSAGIRHELRLEFDKFVVDDFNGISGMMTLYVIPDTPEEEARARNAGLYRLGTRPRLERVFRLAGKRFRATNIQVAEKQQLNRSYRIKIQEPNPKYTNTNNSSSNIDMSPIEQVANGVLLLVGLPLLIITLSGKCMKDDNCLR